MSAPTYVERNDEENEKQLWCAVLGQVIADATTTRTGKDAQRDQREAIEWLLTGTVDFRTVCTLAGVDPEAVHAHTGGGLKVSGNAAGPVIPLDARDEKIGVFEVMTSTLTQAALRHLNLGDFTGEVTGVSSYEVDTVERLIDAANNWLEAQLGYKLGERYPPSGSPLVSTVPAALDQAALLLVAHWYANREATLVGVNATPLPLGLSEIIQDYRDWSWGEADA